MINENTVIVIERSENQEIRITRSFFYGMRYYDIRIYGFAYNKSRMQPTRKGITLNEQELLEVLRGIRALIRET